MVWTGVNAMAASDDEWINLVSALSDTPDELSFRSVRSTIDTWRGMDVEEAIRFARNVLSKWPDRERVVETSDFGNDIEYETTETLINSTSWPLVRGIEQADASDISMHFKRFSKAELKYLHFRYCDIGILSRCSLDSLHSLRSVKFNSMPFGSDVAAVLSQLPSCFNELWIGSVASHDAWDLLLTALKIEKNSRLQHLKTGYVNPGQVARFFEILQPKFVVNAHVLVDEIASHSTQFLQQMTEFDVSGQRINEVSADVLTSIKAFANLETINFATCGLIPSTVAKIIGSFVRPCTRKLILNNNNVGEEGCYAIAESNHSSLVELQLSRCGLAGAQAKHLFSDAGISTLDSLLLDANPLGESEDTTEFFANLSFNSTRLELLDVSDCGLADEGIVEFMHSRSSTSLKTLRLSRNVLTDYAVSAISSSPAMINLLALSIDHNNISNEGYRAILKSKYLKNLKGIAIGGSSSEELGSDIIAQMLNSQSFAFLRWVAVSQVGFDDRHALAIKDIHWTAMKSLRELAIDSSSLGDVGIAALGHSKSLSALWTLRITNNVNAISDYGLLELAKTGCLNNLVELTIDNVECDDKTILSFADSPICRKIDRIRLGQKTALLLQSNQLRPVLRSFLSGGHSQE